jgi:hypothetical protein
VPVVSAAVDATPDAVAIRADPGSWTIGATDLPAYIVEAQVSL